MSGDVITLGNLGNPQHRSILRHISDVFDNNKGKIDGYVALTKFHSNGVHTILFNSLSPDLNGKQLLSVENNDSVLYAPIEIQSITSNDPRNNSTINVLTSSKNKEVWEAISDDKIIKLLLRLDESNEESIPPPIEGLSIRFADAMRTKYRVSITMVNSNNEILSQISNMDSSFESNNAQFFKFSKPVEGATRIVVDIELVGTNIYEWKISNITLYSHMNGQSLKALADAGVIIYNEYPNSVLSRQAKDDILKIDEVAKPSNEVLKKENVGKALPAAATTITDEKTFENTDSYGTPLVTAPKLDHQFFDRLDESKLKKISSIKRLYSTTDLKNGHKIYTYETNPDTKNITLTFSPTEEVAKYPDEAQYEMSKIIEQGYIKKGGFKNYCLTFYVKLDEISMQDQFLVWKYGGWLWNDQMPELARSTDVYVPITGSDHRPRVFAEYLLNNFREIKDNITINDIPTPVIPEGKWVGFQLIRQVQDDGTCAINIDINKDPYDEETGQFNTTNFEPYFEMIDVNREGDESHGDSGHQANIWGGLNELLSIGGSKYISFYGISLYELDI